MLRLRVKNLRGVSKCRGARREELRAADVGADADCFQLARCTEKRGVRVDRSTRGKVQRGHINGRAADAADRGSQKFHMLALMCCQLVGDAGHHRIGKRDLGTAGHGTRARPEIGCGQTRTRRHVGVELRLQVLQIEREVQHVEHRWAGDRGCYKRAVVAAAGQCGHTGGRAQRAQGGEEVAPSAKGRGARDREVSHLTLGGVLERTIQNCRHEPCLQAVVGPEKSNTNGAHTLRLGRLDVAVEAIREEAAHGHAGGRCGGCCRGHAIRDAKYLRRVARRR